MLQDDFLMHGNQNNEMNMSRAEEEDNRKDVVEILNRSMAE